MANNKKKGSSASTVSDSTSTLHKNLSFTGAEQYKILRTNLSFTLPVEVKCPIIGVTSSMRGEGKSTTSINLSYTLSETGKKVVLIDGDLRIPSVASRMQIPSSPGVTDLLIGSQTQNISCFKSDVSDNWYIIPAGELPPNPSELLGSKRMARLLQMLSENFDYIVIDLPPVNVVSDALTLSHILTGLVLVVRENYCSKYELNACVRQLRLSNVNVLGCVLNGTSSGSGYGRYKRYGKYGKHMGKYYRKNAAYYTSND